MRLQKKTTPLLICKPLDVDFILHNLGLWDCIIIQRWNRRQHNIHVGYLGDIIKHSTKTIGTSSDEKKNGKNKYIPFKVVILIAGHVLYYLVQLT